MNSFQRGVVLVGLIVAIFVAIVRPPLVLYGTGGGHVNARTFCAQDYGNGTPSDVSKCLSRAAIDSQTLGVYLLGILGGSALLAWAARGMGSTHA